MPRRYVRFAQAIALLSSAGCYLQHGLPEERTRDAGRADVGTLDGGLDACSEPGCECRALACDCPGLDGRGTCPASLLHCCPVVGPLAPPDLT